MAAGRHYKFAGSHIQIQTGLGTPFPITGITNAEPAEITATNSLALGDVVKLAAAMAGLSGNLYAVDNPDGTGFELAGTDSTNYPAFVLNSPNLATAAKVAFSEFCELTSVNAQGGSAESIETTTVCSTAREYDVGLRDSGSLSFDFNLAALETVQAALLQSQKDGTALAYKIVFPADGGTAIMTGFVESFSFTGSVNGVWTASASIKLTGEILVQATAA